jgi:hypothetical protein
VWSGRSCSIRGSLLRSTTARGGQASPHSRSSLSAAASKQSAGARWSTLPWNGCVAHSLRRISQQRCVVANTHTHTHTHPPTVHRAGNVLPAHARTPALARTQAFSLPQRSYSQHWQSFAEGLVVCFGQWAGGIFINVESFRLLLTCMLHVDEGTSSDIRGVCPCPCTLHQPNPTLIQT